MHPLHPGVLPGLPHVSRSCGFLCDKGSTCCTCSPGWAGCMCRPCCWLGIVATQSLEHGSCLGIFATSLPSVPTTLSGGAGAVLDPGARLAWALLGVFGPPLPSCPSVFSLVGRELCSVLQNPLPCCLLGQHVGSSSVCSMITWKVPGHGLPLGLPGQEPGSPSAASTALSHLGAGQEGLCWQMGCSILQCILCCVSPDLALHHYKEHHSWFALGSAHHAEPSPRQRPTCVSCYLSSCYLCH